jgi:hypothetical protein
MVDYTILNGYVKNGKTLGKENLGLEEVKGVVVANEFANLNHENEVNNSQVLAQGKTQIKVASEDKARTMNITTKITDIGESRVVYTQNGSKVLDIADSGKNTVKQYGAGVNVGTPAKFQSVAEMSKGSDTEFFYNFDRYGYWQSDYRIEYEIVLEASADYMAGLRSSNRGEYTGPVAGKYTYTKAIPVGEDISWTDYEFIQRIFTNSNGLTSDDNTTGTYKLGKVYVKTQTKDDISDDISFKTFCNDYLNTYHFTEWVNSNNGQWVKFIDNNADGVCEYAFLTQYTLDEVISSYTNKAGDTVMQYVRFDDDDHTDKRDDYTVRYMEDDEAIERDVAVGDIVLAARIDNQILVSKPETVTTSVNSYNYKTDEIAAADGETYGQSGIGYADVGMQYLIGAMAPKTTYEMFLDKFGFVRAYRQPGGTQYALVTELYYTNNAQGNLVQNWPMKVELVMPDENGKPVSKEYDVANVATTALRGTAPWTLINNVAQAGNFYNWLQPAISHLGVTWTGMTPIRQTPSISASRTATFWKLDQQVIRDVTGLNASTEFDYGKQKYYSINPTTGMVSNTLDAEWNPTVSFTNVAVVGIDGNSATIDGAATVKLNGNGVATGLRNANDYAVDYIQLDHTKDVAAGAASYTIGGLAAYQSENNYVVHADKDTEIYVVSDNDVQYFKGYTNMPKLTNKDNNIHAAYAVARNTNKDSGTKAYWMADVIVYEVETWNDLSKASISLAYYTAFQQMQSANGVTINTLNNKTDPAKVDLIPSNLAWGTTNNWWSNWGFNAVTGYGWQGYGFYQLYNTTDAVDGVMTAAAIEYIGEKYNKNGIYAGTVTREVETAIKGGYIPVNMNPNSKNADGTLKTEGHISIATGKIYSVTDGRRTNDTWQARYWEANNLQYNNTQWSDVKADDQIIWVGAGTKSTTVDSAAFIVDLGNTNQNVDPLLNNYDLYYWTPQWLKDIYADIMEEQSADAPTVDDNGIDFTDAKVGGKAVAGGKVTLDDNVAADVATTVTFKTNADVIGVMKDGVAKTGTTTTDLDGVKTWTLTEAVAATGTTTRTVTYDIILRMTDAKDPTKTYQRNETITVTVNPASTDKGIKSITVRGVDAVPGSTANTWTVNLTAAQADTSSTAADLVVVTTDSKAKSIAVAQTTATAPNVAPTKGTTDGSIFTAAHTANTFTNDAVFTVTVTDEGDNVGTTQTVTIKVSTPVTGPTLAASDTASKSGYSAQTGTQADPHILTVGAKVDITNLSLTDAVGIIPNGSVATVSQYLKVTDAASEETTAVKNGDTIVLTTRGAAGTETKTTYVKMVNEKLSATPTYAAATGITGTPANLRIVLDNTKNDPVAMTSAITGWTVSSTYSGTVTATATYSQDNISMTDLTLAKGDIIVVATITLKDADGAVIGTQTENILVTHD